MKKNKTDEINKPIDQKTLFGFDSYFIFFEKLIQNGRLPNSMMLSGQKGTGKATFIYHFINFLLSKNEENKYVRKNFSINHNSSSYKLIKSGTHPNLFFLDSLNDENIKIEQIRKLLLFLNKSAYNDGIKIVLLDNAEYLNINSSNALLKAIEEPTFNTYFFIINNDSKKILNTIKSRCIDFKINFNLKEKRNIFYKISNEYDLNFVESDLDNFLYFDTHGNFLKYLSALNGSKIDESNNYLSCIDHFMNLYIEKNDPKILNYLSVFIQSFYNRLSLKNSQLIANYHRNLYKILYLIRDMKTFHLDKENLFFSIDKIIKNER